MNNPEFGENKGSLTDIEGFLIDLDGVLYTGTQPVTGAREVLRVLERRGYPYRFMSNSTRRCRASIAEKLHQMGFSIKPSLIITPAIAAANSLKDKGKESCMLISTGDVYRDFEDAGIYMRDPFTNTVVMADAGDAFTYGTLTDAFRLLLAGADLIALEKDRFWMGREGLMLSAGPYVVALEFASGKESSLIGKPSPEFFLQGVRELGLDCRQVAMIGDDITSDIGGAQGCGIHGILVKTGKYRKEEVQRSTIQPYLILDSIANLPEYLRRSR
ncbi:MAG: TIGR01458 family HAD-type hydrolase [Methanomicrobiales archaeon]|nr:TIGR01458 family HAD-type hydrolase [Methanomicrobiales archaeon]